MPSVNSTPFLDVEGLWHLCARRVVSALQSHLSVPAQRLLQTPKEAYGVSSISLVSRVAGSFRATKLAQNNTCEQALVACVHSEPNLQLCKSNGLVRDAETGTALSEDYNELQVPPSLRELDQLRNFWPGIVASHRFTEGVLCVPASSTSFTCTLNDRCARGTSA